MEALRRAPALWPAVAFLAGVGLEAEIVVAPHSAALVVVAALAAATRSRWGKALAALALGILTGVVEARPPREMLARVDPERPVEAVIAVSAPAQRWGEAWAAPVRLRVLRQGPLVSTEAAGVWLLLVAVDPPAVGSVLRVRGTLSTAVGFANLNEPWVRPARRLRVKSWRLVDTECPPGPLGRFQLELRRRAVEAGGTRPGPGLARALILGDSRALPERWVRGLRRTGLVHLLSLSGLHVAMLGGLVLLAASPFGRRWQRALVAIAVLVYLAIAGPFPALLRAVAMGLLGLLAFSLRRPPFALNALAVAASLLVALSPELIHDLGFQLSCSATAGLVILSGPIANRLGLLPEPLARALGATLGAQIASLPWALPVFSMLSPLSPLLNLIAVPWASVVLATALIWLPLAWTAPAIARAAVPVLDLLALPMEGPAALPAAAWVVAPIPTDFVGASLLAMLVCGLILLPWRRGHSLALLLGLLGLEGSGRQPEARFEVVFLDVGQGDSILLRDGDRAVLVDGGGVLGIDLGQRVLVPTLTRLGVRRLAAVALTHPDLDHCGGLLDLSFYLPIEELWLPRGLSGDGCAGELAGRFSRSTRRLAAGSELTLGRWRIRVLSPAVEGGPQAENDRSLVLLAEGGGRRVMLAADLEAAGERALLAVGPLPACDVLKVGHHGGASSSSSNWLAGVRPRLSIVSCGVRNRYGHPSPDAIARLAVQGARILRTDRDGIIRLRWKLGDPLEILLPASPR